jgi:hypothetical protein
LQQNNLSYINIQNLLIEPTYGFNFLNHSQNHGLIKPPQQIILERRKTQNIPNGFFQIPINADFQIMASAWCFSQALKKLWHSGKNMTIKIF